MNHFETDIFNDSFGLIHKTILNNLIKYQADLFLVKPTDSVISAVIAHYKESKYNYIFNFKY